MALRVVVLGQVPASLPQQLSNLPAELDLSVVGYHTHSAAAREALTLAPDIALVSAVLDDMGGLARADSGGTTHCGAHRVSA
jgi:hypothetical protein